ncbi:MAG: hypothetical protein JSU77_10195 [Fidelibacterota bacterium]|nr:MAG: hypothetical protein JSU77_10195 [Candidatus Neomarinimicrobiota bacterium]
MQGTVIPVPALENGAGQEGQSHPRLTHPERGPSDSDSCEAVLWRGIDAMYSYRFHEAEAALDSAIALDPYHPVAPFVAVANQWQLRLAEEGYRASHEALLEAVNATIPKYEAMISRYGRRADILLFLGSTYGLRTRVHLADKSWLAGLYSGIKGWGLVRQAYALDSTLADAYLPIGIFDYYAGMHSAPVQLVARLFGINPDRPRGIRVLQRAVSEAPYAWMESASTLSIVYLYIEDDPEMVYRYTDLLLSHYPDNYYFNFLMGEALVGTKRLAQAREFMPRLKDLYQRSHPGQRLEWELKFAALEAALAFEEGDPDRALERCGWVIDNYDMEFDWHLGIVHYIRGQIREGRADLVGARADYRVVAGLGNRTYLVGEARAALDRVSRMMAGR